VKYFVFMAPAGSCLNEHLIVEYMQGVQQLLDEMEEQVQKAVDDCQDRFGRIKKTVRMMVEKSCNEGEGQNTEKCAKSEHEDLSRSHPMDEKVNFKRGGLPRTSKGDGEDPLMLDLSSRSLCQKHIDCIEDVYNHLWHTSDSECAEQFPQGQEKTGLEETRRHANIVSAAPANGAQIMGRNKFFLGTPPNSPTQKHGAADLAKGEVLAVPAASSEAAQTPQMHEAEQQTEIATLPPHVPSSSSSSCQFLGTGSLPPVTDDQKLVSMVAVIVPYRDDPGKSTRYNQWHHLKERLAWQIKRSNISWLLVLVEQSRDGQKFNRGELLNIGFLEAQRYCEGTGMQECFESVIFHDVDMVPDTHMLSYYELRPQRGEPVHLSAPEILGSSKYCDEYGEENPWIGGVLALHPQDFISCNGFALGYWGWGYEDVQLRVRLKHSHGFRKLLRPATPKDGHGYHDMDRKDIWHQFCRPDIEMTQSLKLLRDTVVVSQRIRDESETLSQDWSTKNGLAGMDGQYQIEHQKVFQLLKDNDDIIDVMLGGRPYPAPQPKKGVFLRLTANLKAPTMEEGFHH